QSNQLSLEGEQWGGGRGAFSFHFVDGLTGLADADGDGHVNLLEITRYLEHRVSAEVAPQIQMPMTVGERPTRLATVDAGLLSALRERRSRETPRLTHIDNRGMDAFLLAGLDSIITGLYRRFETQLDSGHLLEPADSSAYALYLILIQ